MGTQYKNLCFANSRFTSNFLHNIGHINNFSNKLSLHNGVGYKGERSIQSYFQKLCLYITSRQSKCSLSFLLAYLFFLKADYLNFLGGLASSSKIFFKDSNVISECGMRKIFSYVSTFISTY